MAAAPILMGSGWFAVRVVYPYASILGIYVMNLYVNILDGQPDVQYGGVFQSGDLVVSSFLAEWSDLRAVNYYLGTAYVKAEPEEYYRAYFGSKDWKVFSDEQMVLEGDTLHMCVY